MTTYHRAQTSFSTKLHTFDCYTSSRSIHSAASYKFAQSLLVTAVGLAFSHYGADLPVRLTYCTAVEQLESAFECGTVKGCCEVSCLTDDLLGRFLERKVTESSKTVTRRTIDDGSVPIEGEHILQICQKKNETPFHEIQVSIARQRSEIGDRKDA